MRRSSRWVLVVAAAACGRAPSPEPSAPVAPSASVAPPVASSASGASGVAGAGGPDRCAGVAPSGRVRLRREGDDAVAFEAPADAPEAGEQGVVARALDLDGDGAQDLVVRLVGQCGEGDCPMGVYRACGGDGFARVFGPEYATAIEPRGAGIWPDLARGQQERSEVAPFAMETTLRFDGARYRAVPASARRVPARAEIAAPPDGVADVADVDSGDARRSCLGAPLACGDRSCCAATRVPRPRGDFVLDRYEVTVGRFAAFVAAGGGGLARGAAEWFARLRCGPLATWPTVPRDPINCVAFDEAQAFCAWDGGRLPTEDEWAWAASGGDEHRREPWGAEPAKPGEVLYDGEPPWDAGSHARDHGRWGQRDMAGSLREWVAGSSHQGRLVARGGDWALRDPKAPWQRDALLPFAEPPPRGALIATSTRLQGRDVHTGFRCARDAAR